MDRRLMAESTPISATVEPAVEPQEKTAGSGPGTLQTPPAGTARRQVESWLFRTAKRLSRALALEELGPIDYLMLAHTTGLAGLSLLLHPRERAYQRLAGAHLAVAGGVIALARLHRSVSGRAADVIQEGGDHHGSPQPSCRSRCERAWRDLRQSPPTRHAPSSLRSLAPGAPLDARSVDLVPKPKRPAVIYNLQVASAPGSGERSKERGSTAASLATSHSLCGEDAHGSGAWAPLARRHIGTCDPDIPLGAIDGPRLLGQLLPFVRETYPLFLLGPMHYWSGELALMVCPRFLDKLLVKIDRRIFRRDLYCWLPSTFPSTLSREVMNAAYFSFYPLIAGLTLATWLRRRERMSELVFTFSFCMYSHFFFFTLVPVIGPTHHRRRLFQRRPLFFERLVTTAIERGDNDGGALPSSHVAGAMVLTAMGGRLFGRKTRRALAGLTTILSVSTVYISMHYPVDVLAGLATGIATSKLAPRLHRRLVRENGTRSRERLT